MKTSGHTRGPWYESETGTHQGLIVNEETGENVAVSYDKDNARLIASAPEMLEVLEKILHADSFKCGVEDMHLVTKAVKIVSKAKGV